MGKCRVLKVGGDEPAGHAVAQADVELGPGCLALERKQRAGVDDGAGAVAQGKGRRVHVSEQQGGRERVQAQAEGMGPVLGPRAQREGRQVRLRQQAVHQSAGPAVVLCLA